MQLYHASQVRGLRVIEPRNLKTRDPNEGPVIFATPDRALATVFIVPNDDSWARSGRVNGAPYIVIGDAERFREADRGGSVYELSSEGFATDPDRGLGEGEWVSRRPSAPLSETAHESGMGSMLESGVAVYVLESEAFQEFCSDPDAGLELLRRTVSENERLGLPLDPNFQRSA